MRDAFSVQAFAGGWAPRRDPPAKLLDSAVIIK